MNTSRRIPARLTSGLAALLALVAVPVLGGDDLYEQSSWVQTASFGGYESLDDDRDIDLIDARIGVGYYFLDGLAVVGEAHVSRFEGHRLDEETGEALDASTSGIGATVLVRWHFLRHERWSSYLDLGWGLGR